MLQVARRAPCIVLAGAASIPVWSAGYIPLQDLPLHAATIRVLASYRDPAYRFADTFVTAFGRTQYLLYHVGGALIARVTNPLTANRVLMSVYLTGTVLTLEWLLAELGHDERLSLLSIPLLFNVPFVLGLLPFLLGLPILFAALATAIRYLRAPTSMTGTALALLAVALFYSHISGFLLFVATFLALVGRRTPRAWLLAVAPCAIVAPIAVWWAAATRAGRISSGVLSDLAGGNHQSIPSSIAAFYDQVGGVFRDGSDAGVFVALALVTLFALIAASAGRRVRPAVGGYVLLPAACLLAYFVLPEGHDYLFFIAQRFAVLFLITAIPLLPMPAGWKGAAVTTAAALVATAAIANAAIHFRDFNRREVGNFEGALEAMPPNSRVCALIFDPASRVVRNAAFLHFGSYYQVSKGGVVMFTYAGYPHWPIDFVPGRYPPPGGPARPRWEWTPQQVPLSEIEPFYDYVLTRGDGFEPADAYRRVWRDDRWSVWARR